MKTLLFTFTLFACADSVSTHQGLSIGAREANPFTANPIVLDVARAGVVASAWVAAPKVEQTHPKLARTVMVGLTVMQGIVVAHNLRQMQLQRGGQ